MGSFDTCVSCCRALHIYRGGRLQAHVSNLHLSHKEEQFQATGLAYSCISLQFLLSWSIAKVTCLILCHCWNITETIHAILSVHIHSYCHINEERT
jgi:hypothetical protein